MRSSSNEAHSVPAIHSAVGLLLTRPRGASQVSCPFSINLDNSWWVSVADTLVPPTAGSQLCQAMDWDLNICYHISGHHGQLRRWVGWWRVQGEYKAKTPAASLEAFILFHQLFLLIQLLVGFYFLRKASFHQNEMLDKILLNIWNPAMGFSSPRPHS